jgi:hypothetical protein
MKGQNMYIRCNPLKIEETLFKIRKLDEGGNLKVKNVVMSRKVFVELFGEPQYHVDPGTGDKSQVSGRTKDSEVLSGVPVEFSAVAGKDAFVMLCPVDDGPMFKWNYSKNPKSKNPKSKK